MKDLSNKNMIHIKSDELEYIQFRRLLEYKNIVHAFTLKPADFGTYKNYVQNKESIKKYLNKLAEKLKIKLKDISRPKQTHTDKVEIIEDGDEGIYNSKFDNVDGFITNKKNKVLMLSFADCTPLIFYDPVKNVIANTHSGWKGTYQEIGVKTVKKMIDEYKTNPKDLICCIGPHIKVCHFEVEKDVKDMFFNKFRNLNNIEKYIIGVGPKYHIDTLGINRELLLEIGLKDENIIDSDICTVCNSEICHSYRMEKEKSGRSVAVIELK